MSEENNWSNHILNEEITIKIVKYSEHIVFDHFSNGQILKLLLLISFTTVIIYGILCLS